MGGISGPAVLPGDVEGSLLIEAIRGTDPDFLMPPNQRLDAGDIAVFEEWILRGAPDPRVFTPTNPEGDGARIIPGGGVPKEAGLDHWAFQPIVSQSVPEVEDDRWASGDIDSFILSRLEAKGLKPSPRAIRNGCLPTSHDTHVLWSMLRLLCPCHR